MRFINIDLLTHCLGQLQLVHIQRIAVVQQDKHVLVFNRRHEKVPAIDKRNEKNKNIFLRESTFLQSNTIQSQ